MTPRKLLIFALAAGLFSGCLSRSGPPKLYFLSTPAPGAAAAMKNEPLFAVALRVSSAEYLRARQMLVQTGPNELRPSEDNVWREAPQAGVARVLDAYFARNLQDCQLTPTAFATTNTAELILEIELRSLQGRLKPQSEAEISAEVRILDGRSRLLERSEMRKTAPWNSAGPRKGYPALAAAESAAADALAQEIGQKVLKWHRKISGR